MFRFVCLALIASIVSADIHFKDCGDNEVINVQIEGCSSPCTLHKGQLARFSIDFKANESSEKTQFKMIGRVHDLEFLVPGYEPDGCKIIKCPLKKGETVNFKYNVTIPIMTPKIEFNVTALLTGDNHKVLTCATVNILIND